MSLSILLAQTTGVSINESGNAPDASAILDVQSSTKGMLIPRMDSLDRLAINNPAQGLMVYDSTTNTFWFHDGMDWKELDVEGTGTLSDMDGDTQVEVEVTPDVDHIRYSTRSSGAGRYSQTEV